MIAKSGKKKKTSWVDRENNNLFLGKHYKIRTEKTGHYYLHGEVSDKTRYVWICLHGYGQLAKYFIQRFEFLDPLQHVVIVPEGLNRFYLEGVNDKPVSNWMTREDRLDEIADYVLYLDALRFKFGWDRIAGAKLFYLGFSQGVTTLMRWMMSSRLEMDHLLLWAGSPPDDIPLELYQSYLSGIDTSLFVGRQDPYLNQERVEGIAGLFQRGGMTPRLHWFDGGHRVEQSVLSDWMRSRNEEG